jgi:hypothetical protein
MANIFISYGREDEKTVEEIYDSLTSEGHSIWMDRKKLLPGQDWKTEIEKAIRNSDIFLACLSTNSVSKIGFVQAELRRAYDVAELMPDGRIYIIPVRLDECIVPSKLQHLQWVNYFETGSRKILLHAINSFSENRKQYLEFEPISPSEIGNDLAGAIAVFLIRHHGEPEKVLEQFSEVSPSRLTTALITVAQKRSELKSVRLGAVYVLQLMGRLNADAWTLILPDASTEMLQEFIVMWGADDTSFVLSADQIRLLCIGNNLPKASSGFGRAVRKFIERGAGYTSSVLSPASTHPSWEVKLDCVKTIIQLDDSDSIETLESFSKMSYFVARSNTIDYIDTKIDNGTLSPEDLQIAIRIADRFVNDGKTRPKTPTMRKAKELLSKSLQLQASRGASSTTGKENKGNPTVTE